MPIDDENTWVYNRSYHLNEGDPYDPQEWPDTGERPGRGLPAHSRHLLAGPQQVERLPDRPRDPADEGLQRHRRRQHPGLRPAVRARRRLHRRPLARGARLDRTTPSRRPPPPPRGDRRRRGWAATPRQRGREPQRAPRGRGDHPRRGAVAGPGEGPRPLLLELIQEDPAIRAALGNALERIRAARLPLPCAPLRWRAVPGCLRS